MISHIDPKVDYAFKRIFGGQANASILVHLLNAVLTRTILRTIAEVDIVNPFNEKEALDDKLSIVDIKARDELGDWYSIEMQMIAVRAYQDRVLYSWAKIFGDQLAEGEPYWNLRPKISISFSRK